MKPKILSVFDRTSSETAYSRLNNPVTVTKSGSSLVVEEKIEVYDKSILTFKSPCSCESITGITINDIIYQLVDPLYNNISESKVFSEGAFISVILDTINNKAFLSSGINSLPEVTPSDHGKVLTINYDKWVVGESKDISSRKRLAAIEKAMTEKVVSLGNTLAWDGEPTHLDARHGGWYKVSDNVPTIEDLVGGTISTTGNIGQETDTTSTHELTADDVKYINTDYVSGGSIISVRSRAALVVTEDNAVCTLSNLKATFLEKGIYFGYAPFNHSDGSTRRVYTSELTSPAFEFTETHMIPKKTSNAGISGTYYTIIIPSVTDDDLKGWSATDNGYELSIPNVTWITEDLFVDLKCENIKVFTEHNLTMYPDNGSLEFSMDSLPEVSTTLYIVVPNMVNGGLLNGGGS